MYVCVCVCVCVFTQPFHYDQDLTEDKILLV